MTGPFRYHTRAMAEPEPLSKVTIFTDGGADPNPGPGGWGAVLIDPASGRTKEMSGGEDATTNNRMELTAAIRALEALKRPSAVDLSTDSQYLRRGVTEWLPGWMARGFRRKDGVLQNEDLWRKLAELVGKHEVRWHWVKGHAGHQHNERADALASAEIARRRKARGMTDKQAAPEAEVFLRVSCARPRGAWAALVRHGGREEVLTGVREGTTANHLDIVGAAEALERLPEGVAVAVYTGSDYLRQGAARWLPAWRRNGWRTKEGAAVKNRDLWERLAAAMARRRVTWPEVKGGAAPEELERLGKVAEAARRGKDEKTG
jgi:ribonuclease HI